MGSGLHAKPEVRHRGLMVPQESRPLMTGWRANSGDYVALAVIAACIMLLHIATDGRYGFHRDELQMLDDARHLAWGFVAFPPFTPFIERISIVLFGTSLAGLRLFSIFAQGAVIILTGLMARELGARRRAQMVAAFAVAITPVAFFDAVVSTYSSFDLLWWVVIAYLLIRLLKYGNPRWWIAVGAVAGLGMLTKYSMTFCVAGILGALLLAPGRRHLRTRWLWYGVALSFLIFLPNLIWEIRHAFVSLHFLQYIHKRDMGEGRTNGFIPHQFILNSNVMLAPLWLAGIFFYFADGVGKRYRLLGWFYVITFGLFFALKGRDYYAAGLYPMLFAGGSVLWERWVRRLRPVWARVLQGATFAAIALGGYGVGRALLPMGPISTSNYALKVNGELREEIGWTDLVAEVARIRDSLTSAQRAHLGIITGNYGETGAIDLYGPRYGLPQAISGTNTAWYRRYGDLPPQTLIVVGLPRPYADEVFQSCRLAGHDGNPYGIENEESRDHPDIFLCGPPHQPWPEFWKRFHFFG
jgi:4-amino-4-deoxy-L-arabinose transferase-like glycosyltransferase